MFAKLFYTGIANAVDLKKCLERKESVWNSVHNGTKDITQESPDSSDFILHKTLAKQVKQSRPKPPICQESTG